MIRDIITSRTRPEDWAGIRGEISRRILESMGMAPELPVPTLDIGPAEALAEGVLARPLTMRILPDYPSEGTLLLPETPGTEPLPCVICIHGTDRELAHRSMFSKQIKPNRAFGHELAARGYAVLCLNQPGFGDGMDDFASWFYERYPDWSLDGVRLHVQQAAIDLIAGVEGIASDGFACIGHSLGGRTALFLAAFDERIRVAVPSTGLSPNCSNVFRNRPGPQSLSPLMDQALAANGHAPWEYQEMLALVAGRALLLIEPWNDAYNPHIEPVWECFAKVRHVFDLLGCPDKLRLLCHGDAHDCVPSMRRVAYDWIDAHLGK